MRINVTNGFRTEIQFWMGNATKLNILRPPFGSISNRPSKQVYMQSSQPTISINGIAPLIKDGKFHNKMKAIKDGKLKAF